MKLLVDGIRPVLDDTVTDKFRAELLLGYIAGLPKARADEDAVEHKDTSGNS
jgi:hypothetical protein